MNTPITTPDARDDLDLQLVDLDDLRAAFGGEAAALAVAPETTVAAVPTSTVMCPNW